MSVAPDSYARILNVHVRDVFRSDEHNQFSATVEIENTSNYIHSAQVVFRGYVRSAKKLHYEFFHEQVWLLVKQKEKTEHTVAVDVWLPRFPPSMKIDANHIVEYSVRASVDPWFENKFVEKIFVVHRTLILKMPHNACFPNNVIVNECIGHGGWRHKKCQPLNGEVWLNKGAYTSGETISIHWKLRNEADINRIIVKLNKKVEIRTPDPGHYMNTKQTFTTIASKDMKLNKNQQESSCSLLIPSDLPITLAMTLWNVLSITYEVLMQVKTAANSGSAYIRIPVIIATESIQARALKRNYNREQLFHRAKDIDDDTDDDDDFDSDSDNSTSEDYPDHSIEIEKFNVKSDGSRGLEDAYAEVTFLMNSHIERPLSLLRLLLLGEVRAGSEWYEFIRYKALISTDNTSAFSPGSHKVRVALPFKSSQYDVNILPPSLGDDIRYICRLSLHPWRQNQVPAEIDIPVDRAVDTFAKEAFKSSYEEKSGIITITMRQRAFQRGKYVIASISGNMQKVVLQLVQQRRIRCPRLQKDDSFCYERVVASRQSPTDQSIWPEEWSIPIPAHIPPSIEISYWNVLILNYALVADVTLENGHTHTHTIPIWIGTTDDHLQPPDTTLRPIPDKPLIREPSLGELPEFEVVDKGDVQEQPHWVQRYNDHTYGYI